MKNFIALFLAVLLSSQLFAQSEKTINIYYGGHYFMPSNGYAHSIGFQKEILKKSFGTINGELSLLYGGPFWFTFFSDDTERKVKVSPYTIFHVAVGPNLEIPLRKKQRKISLGLSSGYSRYEIPIVSQTLIGNGGSVQIFFQERQKLLLAGSLKYIHEIEIYNLNISVVPNYNFYRTSIITQSLGLLLRFNFN